MEHANDYRPSPENHNVLLITNEFGLDTAFVWLPEMTEEEVVEKGYSLPTEDELSKLPKVVVPVVTARQLRHQLIEMDLMPMITAFLDSIPESKEKSIVINHWEYSQDFDRNHPVMLQLIELLQISDENADELFIRASKL